MVSPGWVTGVWLTWTPVFEGTGEVYSDGPDIGKEPERLGGGVPEETLSVKEDAEITELAIVVGEFDTVMVGLGAVHSVVDDHADVDVELGIEKEELDVKIVDASVVTMTGDEDGEFEISDDELEVDALEVGGVEL